MNAQRIVGLLLANLVALTGCDGAPEQTDASTLDSAVADAGHVAPGDAGREPGDDAGNESDAGATVPDPVLALAACVAMCERFAELECPITGLLPTCAAYCDEARAAASDGRDCSDELDASWLCTAEHLDEITCPPLAPICRSEGEAWGRCLSGQS